MSTKEERAEKKHERQERAEAAKEALAEDSPEFVGPPRPPETPVEETAPVKQVVFKAKLKMVRVDPRMVSFQVTPAADNIMGFQFPTQVQIPRNQVPKNDDFNLDFINSELPPDSDPKDVAKQKTWRGFLNMELQVIA